jgi:acetyl-CoA acetyltransferase
MEWARSAIGHPFCSSGTRYVLTLATELRGRNAHYGIAVMSHTYPP